MSTTTSSYLDILLPPQFRCPFTGQRMTQPVMALDCGHHFEQAALEQALAQEGEAVCPIDRKRLDPGRLLPAREFGLLIKNWESHLAALHAAIISRPPAPTQPPPVPAIPPAVAACWTSPNGPQQPVIPTPKFAAPHLPGTPGGPISLAPTPSLLGALSSSLDDLSSLQNGLPPPPQSKALPRPDTPGDSPEGSEMDPERAPVDPRKYKTRLCRNWIQTGHCSYEHTCCFAHGESEMRDPIANMKILNTLGYFLTPEELARLQAEEAANPQGPDGSPISPTLSMAHPGLLTSNPSPSPLLGMGEPVGAARSEAGSARGGEGSRGPKRPGKRAPAKPSAPPPQGPPRGSNPFSPFR